MIQAKVYAPTIQHHREAADLTKPRRASRAFQATAMVALLTFAYHWWRSDFAFPLTFSLTDFIVGVIITAGCFVYSLFDTDAEAKKEIEFQELDGKAVGPTHYRATLQGLEWWCYDTHGTKEWGHFDRYKITDDLLIVAKLRTGEYWALPRADLGPELVSALLDKLRQGGAKEVAGRPRPNS